MSGGLDKVHALLLYRRINPTDAVNAGDVLLRPVLTDAVPPLAGGPLVHGRSMPLQGHQGHAVAARVRSPPHGDDDARADPYSCTALEIGGERLELRIVGQHDPARPVQAHDPRRAREGAEHDHDPAVLPEMCDGLDTTPRLVEKGHRARTENSELVAVALGRAVH